MLREGNRRGKRGAGQPNVSAATPKVSKKQQPGVCSGRHGRKHPRITNALTSIPKGIVEIWLGFCDPFRDRCSAYCNRGCLRPRWPEQTPGCCFFDASGVTELSGYGMIIFTLELTREGRYYLCGRSVTGSSNPS